jgi:YfiH family protein
VIVQQVHGRAVVSGDELTSEARGDVITLTRSDRAACVLVADCVPVVLFDTRTRRLAVAHAGWRGLRDGALQAAVASLGADPADLLAGIGPSISVERYQVGPEVAHEFRSVPGAVWADVDDRSRLDLRAISVAQLESLALARDRIFVSDEVTDGAETYFSDRHERPCGRFALAARFLVA